MHMDKVLEQLVAKLQRAFGERLVSVVLYGSAAAGDRQAKFSDYNVLCVLTEITRRELAASEPVFQWWRGHDSPSPLLLTEAELARSGDCFAIEIRDILRHHRILFGKDVTAGLAVSDAFYRAQVEHDLRAKLLRLRQKAAGALSEPDQLRRLPASATWWPPSRRCSASIPARSTACWICGRSAPNRGTSTPWVCSMPTSPASEP